MKFSRVFALFLALLLVAGCSSTEPPSAEPEPNESAQQNSQSASPSPTPTIEYLSWGPTEAEWDEASEIVEQLSVAQQAGQTLMADFTGTEAVPLELIRTTHLGGMILMENNIITVAQTKALTTMFDDASQEASGQQIPALIGIDQEGGLVQRFIPDDERFPTAMAYGAIYETDPDRAQGFAQEGYQRIGQQLVELGVTIDFAPVADVTVGATDPVIGARSFSANPQTVSELAGSASAGLVDAGIVPVIKHFPGHGSVSTDSHQSLPVYEKDLTELAQQDWVPFQSLVAAGAPAVMIGHIATATEPTLPASLNPQMYSMLEENLNFAGLNVTDALNMGAITAQYGPADAAATALEAGADLVLMPTDVQQAHGGIVAAVEQGSLSEERLAEAATKVVATKFYQQRLASESEKVDSTSDEDFIQQVFAAAITDVSEHCAAEPVAGATSAVYGADAQQQGFLSQSLNDSAAPARNVALIGIDQLSVDGEVTITLNSPWPLATSSASYKYALYGKGPAAMAALSDVLSGREIAPGKLPAPVGSYPVGTGC